MLNRISEKFFVSAVCSVLPCLLIAVSFDIAYLFDRSQYTLADIAFVFWYAFGAAAIGYIGFVVGFVFRFKDATKYTNAVWLGFVGCAGIVILFAIAGGRSSLRFVYDSAIYLFPFVFLSVILGVIRGGRVRDSHITELETIEDEIKRIEEELVSTEGAIERFHLDLENVEDSRYVFMVIANAHERLTALKDSLATCKEKEKELSDFLNDFS